MKDKRWERETESKIHTQRREEGEEILELQIDFVMSYKWLYISSYTNTSYPLTVRGALLYNR